MHHEGNWNGAVPVESVDEVLKSANNSMLFRIFDNAFAYNSGNLSLESSIKSNPQIVTPLIPSIVDRFRKKDSPSAIVDRVELINALKSADAVSQKRAIPSINLEIDIAELVVSQTTRNQCRIGSASVNHWGRVIPDLCVEHC